jgi:hypothetical protein
MSQPSIKFWAALFFGVVCLAAWLFLGCRESRTQREEDISEVVFRRLLEMPDVRRSPSGTGVCILNEQRRFDSKFLGRFKNGFPGLSLTRQAQFQSLQEKLPKEPAKCEITIWVGDIRSLNSSDVDVDAGYNCGPLCAYGGHFHLRRAGWGWYVESVSDSYIAGLTGPASIFQRQ